ncbi:MAG: UDP-N-acetylmuramoyl-L-alanyl-D-glutamate--2,6-diaminopimelate ligase [Candidatus Omnitrophica bacterium]|nr:UDP-N-acetylmuramoyl-L-alanyl-D-glutamate--2,6-diaminopimelate ligase [Candidatus Omnitrophota bacterium]
MKLHHLLKDVDIVNITGNKYIDITNISYDSKQLKEGGLFFAIKGEKHNGADFIDEAIERGAVSIVSEDDFITFKSVSKVRIKDIRSSCAKIANNFYGYPSQKIDVTGITGTNGKTTILYLIEAILSTAGLSCGTIGTISYNVGERKIPAINTTPSAIMLQRLLNDMVNANVANCIMEVSSHSLHQRRVEGIDMSNAIFTNLSAEHLDYHKDMEEYFKTKSMLFNMIKDDGYAIVNIDDEHGRRIVENIKSKVLTYALNREADLVAFDVSSSIKGSKFKIKTADEILDIKTPLIGEYNIYNILAAIAFAVSKNIDKNLIIEAIKEFKGAPGRLQRVESEGRSFDLFVDYAHTDDALRNVLSALRNIAKGKIFLVFGCGGERDKTKRPRMGRISAELSDFSIITNDNPRSEDPKAIIDDIIKGIPDGFKDYKVLPDRKKAIEDSVSMAGENDIVLIAGKGHEKYQILKDTTISFDDCRACEEALAKKRIKK